MPLVIKKICQTEHVIKYQVLKHHHTQCHVLFITSLCNFHAITVYTIHNVITVYTYHQLTTAHILVMPIQQSVHLLLKCVHLLLNFNTCLQCAGQTLKLIISCLNKSNSSVVCPGYHELWYAIAGIFHHLITHHITQQWINLEYVSSEVSSMHHYQSIIIVDSIFTHHCYIPLYTLLVYFIVCH